MASNSHNAARLDCNMKLFPWLRLDIAVPEQFSHVGPISPQGQKFDRSSVSATDHGYYFMSLIISRKPLPIDRKYVQFRRPGIGREYVQLLEHWPMAKLVLKQIVKAHGPHVLELLFYQLFPTLF